MRAVLIGANTLSGGSKIISLHTFHASTAYDAVLGHGASKNCDLTLLFEIKMPSGISTL